MPSNWYYKQNDQELGPYTFRDLVEMVREEQLLTEILIRPHYMDEWQRADSVVGLFHMARRDPATLPPVKEMTSQQVDEYADTEDLEEFISSSEEPVDQADLKISEEIEKPSWLKRLLSLRNSKIFDVPVDLNCDRDFGLSRPVATNESLDPLVEPVGFESENHLAVDDGGTKEKLNSGSIDEAAIGAYSEDTWSLAIDAAVERIDSRAPKSETEPVPKKIMPTVTFSFLDSPAFRKFVLLGAIILCISLAIYGFVDWMGQGTLIFPFIGACSPLLFLAYSTATFVGIIIVGSLLVYFSSFYLRIGFKLGSVFVTAYFLLHWSQEEAMVFPFRKPTEANLMFPLMGECSPFAYWMYFFDVIIFVVILTFLIASWLEARADDV